MATKEGDAEFYPLLGAVNQYPDADYYPLLLGYCFHSLTDGATGGEDIINNKDSLTWFNTKISSKGPFGGAGLFGKYAAYS